MNERVKFVLGLIKSFGYSKLGTYVFAFISFFIALYLFVSVAVRGSSGDFVFSTGYVGLGAAVFSFGFFLLGKLGFGKSRPPENKSN